MCSTAIFSLRGEFTDLMDRALGTAGLQPSKSWKRSATFSAGRLSFQAVAVPAAGMESGGESTGSMTRPPTVIQRWPIRPEE